MRRIPRFLPALFLLAAACASTEVPAAPTEGEVVASFQEIGLTEDTSSCVVGLGRGQMELAELDPAAVEPEIKNAIREFVAACERAERLMNAEPPAPKVEEVDEPFEYGDSPELDELWDKCADGSGWACDELWSQAPLDSAYETFGVTCGERPGILDCLTLGTTDPS